MSGSAFGSRTVFRLGKEFGSGGNLSEKVRTHLKHPMEPLAGRIEKIACPATKCQFSNCLTVFPGSNKFSTWYQESIGSQWGGLFRDTFFSRKVRYPADEEIGSFLGNLHHGLVFEHPLIVLMDQHVLLVSRFHRQHRHVHRVESKEAFVLKIEKVSREVLDQNRVYSIERTLRGGLRDRFTALRVRLIKSDGLVSACAV